MIALILKSFVVHWQAAAIGALIVFGGIEWTAHNRAEQAKGAAEVRWHLADSTLAVLKAQKAKIDTQYVHDTLTFTKLVTVQKVKRDTLLQHLTDTLQVIQYVHVTDSTIKACSDLFTSCKARADNLEQQLVQERAKVTVAPLVSQRSCLGSNAVVGLGGVVVGWLVGKH